MNIAAASTAFAVLVLASGLEAQDCANIQTPATAPAEYEFYAVYSGTYLWYQWGQRKCTLRGRPTLLVNRAKCRDYAFGHSHWYCPALIAEGATVATYWVGESFLVRKIADGPGPGPGAGSGPGPDPIDRWQCIWLEKGALLYRRKADGTYTRLNWTDPDRFWRDNYDDGADGYITLGADTPSGGPFPPKIRVFYHVPDGTDIRRLAPSNCMDVGTYSR